jgi:hypothetical protein
MCHLVSTGATAGVPRVDTCLTRWVTPGHHSRCPPVIPPVITPVVPTTTPLAHHLAPPCAHLAHSVIASREQQWQCSQVASQLRIAFRAPDIAAERILGACRGTGIDIDRCDPFSAVQCKPSRGVIAMLPWCPVTVYDASASREARATYGTTVRADAGPVAPEPS